jgi:hypothetical protein
LANFYKEKSNTQKALELLNKCMVLKIKSFGENSIELAHIYEEIG